jgi:DNA repair exonuclease SbcCD ATPase subunit
MTKTQARAVDRSEPAAHRPPAARDDGGGAEVLGAGNLDQVREILFGAQSRSLEKRVARLEEQIVKAVAELREEIKGGLHALESYAKHELESLDERLGREQSERAGAVDEASERLEEMSRSTRKELDGLVERLGKSERDLRQQLLDQSKRLEEEIRRRSEATIASLTGAIDELRSEKTDRAALAALLSEVAMRLTDELQIALGGKADSPKRG